MRNFGWLWSTAVLIYKIRVCRTLSSYVYVRSLRCKELIFDIFYQISPRHFSGFRMMNHYFHSDACLPYILCWPRKLVNKGWETNSLKPNSSLQLVYNWPYSISPQIPYQRKSWTNNIRVATFRPGLARSVFKYQYKNSI